MNSIYQDEYETILEEALEEHDDLDEEIIIRLQYESRKKTLIKLFRMRKAIGPSILEALWNEYRAGGYRMFDEMGTLREWADAFIAPELYDEEDDKRYLFELADVASNVLSDIYEHQFTQPYVVDGVTITVDYVLENIEEKGLVSKLREMKQFFYRQKQEGQPEEAKEEPDTRIITPEDKEKIVETVMTGTREEVRKLRKTLNKKRKFLRLPTPILTVNEDGTTTITIPNASPEQLALFNKITEGMTEESSEEEDARAN